MALICGQRNRPAGNALPRRAHDRRVVDHCRLGQAAVFAQVILKLHQSDIYSCYRCRWSSGTAGSKKVQQRRHGRGVAAPQSSALLPPSKVLLHNDRIHVRPLQTFAEEPLIEAAQQSKLHEAGVDRITLLMEMLRIRFQCCREGLASQSRNGRRPCTAIKEIVKWITHLTSITAPHAGNLCRVLIRSTPRLMRV